MVARARALTETDEAEWARYARQIVPLPGKRPLAVPDAPSPSAVSPARPAPSRVAVTLAHAVRPPPLCIGGQPAGVDTASWQRFSRGKLGVPRKLDMHGMTAQRAFHALSGFLRGAHADRLRCVEVVTGRGTAAEGGGVIWREFPLWLNLPDIRPMVLAATYPHAANTGAVRLLLRRPRA